MFRLSLSGARTVLPMGVAPEIKLNCLQLRLNSNFPQSKSPLPMGVKKRLDLLESRLALFDLLCTQPCWLTCGTRMSLECSLSLTAYLMESTNISSICSTERPTVLLDLYGAAPEWFECDLRFSSEACVARAPECVGWRPRIFG